METIGPIRTKGKPESELETSKEKIKRKTRVGTRILKGKDKKKIKKPESELETSKEKIKRKTRVRFIRILKGKDRKKIKN